MAESHVISALVTKRAELAGLRDHYQKEVKRLSDEIQAIEASIKIFEPDYNLRAIKPKAYRPTNQYFKPREANMLVLDVLREAGEPLDTGEVTRRIAAKKGYDLEEIDYTKFQSYLGTVMARQKKKGIIQEVGRVGGKGVILWALNS